MDKLVKISSESHQTLVALAAKKQRSLKDFLEQSINYFNTLGTDPREIDSESIRAEIKKLDRRIVSFFRTQESEKIAPILDELSIISKTITESLKVAPAKKDFALLADIVQNNVQKILDSQNNVARKMAETRLKEMSELKQKARRIFNEYLEEVENKGTLVSRRPIDEKFTKLFETI